ncbi:MAG: pyridoxal-phosphate dependent enzyme, partial [Patescibacteria group bacterium]
MNPTINLKTPLIRLTNLEKTLGWTGQLWAKCEFQNPTGSFKDRGSVVEINQALKQNKKGVVCASTGNLAISVAAFATQKNLPCVVFIPQQTSSNKLKQATTRGAVLKKVINYDQCVIKA